MTLSKKPVYRVVFYHNGDVYELHAREVAQSDLYAFIEVGDIIFGERSNVVVDPSEERLKSEFSGVRRTYIPMHAVVRIDEVEKEGANKITPSSGEKSNVMAFPMNFTPPGTRTE